MQAGSVACREGAMVTIITTLRSQVTWSMEGNLPVEYWP